MKKVKIVIGLLSNKTLHHSYHSSMTSKETLNYCIETLEAELEDLARQIQEETNFEHNALDFLSEQYDVTESHLINLKNLLETLI